MEGRDHPTVANDGSDPLVLSQSLPPPLTPPTSEKSNTYIVQVPRDQIYRVPPPENSKFVESFQTLPNKRKKKGCSPLWCFLLMIVLLLITGCVLALTYFALYKPEEPTISITNIKVKNSTEKHAGHAFAISLRIDNPNEKMGVSYRDGGTASLSYNEKKIGEGKYPTNSQDAKDSKFFYLTLPQTKSLPSQIEDSINDKDGTASVGLSLAIAAPIELKGVLSFTKDLKVKCEITVTTLGIGSTISSQKCSSEI